MPPPCSVPVLYAAPASSPPSSPSLLPAPPPPCRMYWLDPLSYTIQGVISSQLSMDQGPLTLPDGTQVWSVHT